jgi:hypothetical protein
MICYWQIQEDMKGERWAYFKIQSHNFYQGPEYNCYETINDNFPDLDSNFRAPNYETDYNIPYCMNVSQICFL